MTELDIVTLELTAVEDAAEVAAESEPDDGVVEASLPAVGAALESSAAEVADAWSAAAVAGEATVLESVLEEGMERVMPTEAQTDLAKVRVAEMWISPCAFLVERMGVQEEP